jgi:MFS family permease
MEATITATPRKRRILYKTDSAMERGYGMMDRTVSMETVDFNNDQQASNGNEDGNSWRQRHVWLFSPLVHLPVLVFIDMFAVALVVPLLFQYYKLAGVTSATQRELLSSVFSASQIVGGILLGGLTDANVLRRRTVLFVSFGGSAVAYLMITYGGFAALVSSRVLVGLVKQTMTITTSMLSRITTDENRGKYMGRLEASMTAAWILGPSMGALLFKCTSRRTSAPRAMCVLTSLRRAGPFRSYLRQRFLHFLCNRRRGSQGTGPFGVLSICSQHGFGSRFDRSTAGESVCGTQ